MASINRQKLMRIDEQILNLEYLYQRELLREAELGKRNLLLSKGFKYRLDSLYKARTTLIKATGMNASKELNYTLVLAERKAAVDEAEQELEVLKQQQVNAGANALLHRSEYYVNEMKDLNKEIIRQEARIRNKKRALNNWIDKAGNVTTNERKISANYNAEEIAVDVNSAAEKFEQHMHSLHVADKFAIKPENNATIDLLTRPEEKKNENVD